MTEDHYVTGFIACFDELRRHHANMLLDTCASGGRRNDLEALRRAVPLTRSDFGYEPTGMQNLTYGMALWIPYFGIALRNHPEAAIIIYKRVKRLDEVTSQE